MRKYILPYPFMLFACLCLPVPPCYGAHLIRFESGESVVVDSYWEEGGRVFFVSEVGQVDMPRDAIVSIVEVEPSAPLPVPPAGVPEQLPEGIPRQEMNAEEIRKAKLYKEYKKQKAELREQVGTVGKRMKMDAFAGRSGSAVRAQLELRAMNKQLKQLEDGARQLMGGTLPEDWNYPGGLKVAPKRSKANKRSAPQEKDLWKDGPDQDPRPPEMTPRERKKELRALRKDVNVAIKHLEKKNSENAARLIEIMRKELKEMEQDINKEQ